MPNGERLSFEEALQELEQMVTRLEASDLTLEEMLKLFERSQELLSLCEKALGEAELRLERLQPASGDSYEAAVPDDTTER
jgi:exodeoxyribonuclease VII small subunit